GAIAESSPSMRPLNSTMLSEALDVPNANRQIRYPPMIVTMATSHHLRRRNAALLLICVYSSGSPSDPGFPIAPTERLQVKPDLTTALAIWVTVQDGRQMAKSHSPNRDESVVTFRFAVFGLFGTETQRAAIADVALITGIEGAVFDARLPRFR